MKFKIIILLLICSIKSYSSEIYPFINPGVSIGIELGQKLMPFVGTELSVGATEGFSTEYGLTAGISGGLQYNFVSKSVKKYCDVEGGTMMVGLALGYEWNSVGNNSPRITCWAGTILYGSFTVTPIATNKGSIAVSGKLPLLAALEVTDYGFVLPNMSSH